MKLTCEDYDELTVMRVRGDLTAEGVDDFKRQARERMEARTRDFVIDASGLDFVDSEGLDSLLWLQEQTSEALGQVRLAQVKDNVKQVLEITRLAARLDCHADMDAAVKSLR